MVPKFPTLDELELDSSLVESFLKFGGKVGVLNWISEKGEIPILPHLQLKNVTLPIIKELIRENQEDVLIRSNNYCELLPCTEGVFSSLIFNQGYNVNDPWKVTQLKKRHGMPAYGHLQNCWPKNQKELRWAAVKPLENCYSCNLIEHPNQEGVFWMTLANPTGTHFTILSDRPPSSFAYPEMIDKLQKETDNGLEKILTIAKKVSGLSGFDPRYSKQMEFVLNKENCYLAQAKIFVPKNITPTPSVQNPSELYSTFGVFDIEAIVEDPLVKKENPDTPTIRMIRRLKEAYYAGAYFKKNAQATIFRDASGLLEHSTTPYFLHSQGLAVGNGHSLVLNKNNEQTFLELQPSQKAHIRSDGHFLYLLD